MGLMDWVCWQIVKLPRQKQMEKHLSSRGATRQLCADWAVFQMSGPKAGFKK
jgi:hypothetical protein